MSQNAENDSVWVRLDEVLGVDPLSERAARAVLLREGADEAAVEEALARVDWDSQAEAALLQEAEMNAFNLVPVLGATALKARGFTGPQIAKALKNADWHGVLDAYIAGFDARPEAPAQLGDGLRELGFSEEQVQAAMEASSEPDPLQKAGRTIRRLLRYGVSRRWLQDFLQEKGYTKQEARAAIRAEHPDWVQQAVMAAETASMSTTLDTAVANRLAEAGFTQSEIEEALPQAAAGGPEAAARSADVYMRTTAVSLDGLRETLAAVGYPPAVVENAIEDLGAEDADWTERGAAAIARDLTKNLEPSGGRDAVAAQLKERGYSKEQIERGLARANIDWAARAVDEFRAADREKHQKAPLVMDSPRSAMRTIEALGYSPQEAREGARLLFHDQDEAAAALSEVRSCVWPCGRQALEEGLREAQYAEDVVQDTMDHVFFDWKERALEAFREGLDESFRFLGLGAPNWMRAMLVLRSFEPEEIEYALENADVDWNQLARTYAQMVRERAEDDDDMETLLREAGFSPEQIEHAIEQTGQEPPT